MKEFPINLEKLKPSRKFPRPGDIFVIKPKGRSYYFGRVIRTDAKIGGHPKMGIGGFENCILLYFYNCSSNEKTDIPDLSPHQLLIPPAATNRQGWLRGYFETVAHQELRPEDVLEVHCFKSLRFKPPRYFDADNNELPGPVEPVGVYALKSYRTIDDAVSDALGIPRAPDE